MKTNIVYPAIFTYNIQEHCYHVEFIDFSCQASGKTIEAAFWAAEEAMKKHFSDTKIFPEMTENIREIKVGTTSFISFVTANMLEYYKKHNNKAVKKTLTIPSWLNELAEEKNINFSHVLQEALKEYLQIK